MLTQGFVLAGGGERYIIKLVLLRRNLVSDLVFFAPTGLRLTAQGCRALAATLGRIKTLTLQPQRGCARSADSQETDATALRLKCQMSPYPRVAAKARQPWAVSRSPVGARGTRTPALGSN